MSKKAWIIIAAVAGVLVLCACVGVGAFVIISRNAGDLTNIAQLTPAAPVVVENTNPGVTPTETLVPIEDLGGQEMADLFMGSLSAGVWDYGYTLCTAELQGELGTAAGLQSLLEDPSLVPDMWEWTDVSENNADNQIYLDGNVNFKDGRSGIVNLELEEVDGTWQVYFINFEANE